MSKKNWISIKRGLSEDPKHRERMGMAVWLFLHIVDAADWETGRVYDWRDKEIGIDMTASTATIREWRQKLANLGYITCIQKQHSLEIIIHNWNNPKEYSSPKINIRQGKSEIVPSEIKENKNAPQGIPQGDNQVPASPIVNPASFIESTSTSTSKVRAPLSSEDYDQCNAKVDAILENERKAQGSWPHREKFPEPIRELLDVYVQVTGQRPTKDMVTDWLASGNDWLELQATPADVRAAYAQAKPADGRGFSVSRPGSLTRKIGEVVGARRCHPAQRSGMDKFNEWIEQEALRNG